MKTIFFPVFIILIMSCSQKKATINNEDIITQKVINKKGDQLVIKEIFNDSRCPEDVTCVWAGEIEIVISLYQDNNFVKDTRIKISPTLNKENIAWFSEYYPSRKITKISVLPNPKNGEKISAKEYTIKIYF